MDTLLQTFNVDFGSKTPPIIQTENDLGEGKVGFFLLFVFALPFLTFLFLQVSDFLYFISRIDTKY